MDLTRSFLEKIEEMTGPKVIEIEELAYSREHLEAVLPPMPAIIKAQSLTALIDYLNANSDQLFPEELLIHVVNETTVQIISSLNPDFRNRENYIQADALLPVITLNRFMDRENFNIMLQSRFVPNEDRARVLSSIAKMRFDNSVKLEDDGVTQTATSAVGVTLVKEEQVPNPVVLAPFRTFTEIDQPESPFILRVNDNCEVGLFEADGGAWRHEAMTGIKAYLETQLGEDYTIIA